MALQGGSDTMSDFILYMDNHIPKNTKFVGYTFMYEKGPKNFTFEKTFKTINAARKAAIPYAVPPSSIYKIFVDKSGKRYGKVVGMVARSSGYNKYTKINDDFETGNKYVINKDGSLGSRITGKVTGSGMFVHLPKGRY